MRDLTKKPGIGIDVNEDGSYNILSGRDLIRKTGFEWFSVEEFDEKFWDKRLA
jgi:hypothetical protein